MSEDETAAVDPLLVDQFKVAAARLWAVSQYPYLASALFACPVNAHPIPGHVTIDRDWRILADPAVVAEVDVDCLGARIIHLVSHVLRDHATRADALSLGSENELVQWVAAADAEISDDYGDLFTKLGDGSDGLFATAEPHDLGLEPGLLAEEYFRHGCLTTVGGPHVDCGSGAHGQYSAHDPPPESNDEDSNQPSESTSSERVDGASQKLIRRQVAAEVLAAPPSSVQPRLRQWAESHLEPVVDWRSELKSWFRRAYSYQAGMVDYSYQRRSRRASATPGVVLAGLQAPRLEVALVCDTSASVTDRQLDQALAEIQSLTHSLGHSHLAVLTCDHAVHQIERAGFTSSATVIGGGGTDMRVGIDAALRLRPSPNIVVVVSDGFTPWPHDPPSADVVVVLLEHPPPTVAPIDPPAWAKTIRVNAI